MGIRVGIDTGGTFTDLVASDAASGRTWVAKVPSNPANPVSAVAAALESASFDAADVEHVVVGTTIGINAVLTRRGARVIYLTTRGFEDIPFIQRINRKYHYDFSWKKPTPMVRRRDCIGAPERLDEEGRRDRAARPRGAARGAARGRARGRRRRRRGLLPVQLPQPGARAADARAAGRAAARRAGVALARGGADLARVRARHDDDRRRVPEAADPGLRRRPRPGARERRARRRPGRC